MFESSFRFARVKGIPIGAHWSWLLVFLLVVWSLATALFPATYPGLSGADYLAMAVIATVLFFGSIVLHEIGHTILALREGMRIRQITLWLFGGVAQMETPMPSARGEFRVAVAGPAVSAALALAFGAVAVALDAAGGPLAIRGVADYLGRINGLLLGFNLVPAPPLDGGRVLHAWLWHRQRDRVAATLSAARAGRAFGTVLVVIGVLNMLGEGGPGGIWLVFIGWFVLRAAQGEAVQALFAAALEHRRVRELMTEDPLTVPAEARLAEIIDRMSAGDRHVAYPVVVGGHLVGLLPLARAVAVPPDERTRVRVADVMVPRADVPTVRPDQPVDEAISALRRAPRRTVVVDHDRAVGLLALPDVVRAVEIERERAEGASRQRRPGLVVWVVVAAAIVIAAGALYHPPYVVVEPGPTFDVRGDVTISGVTTEGPTGPYLATSVRLTRPNAIETLIAAARSDREVIPLADLLPIGVDPDTYVELQRRAYADSQQLAAVAAARANGLTAHVDGDGATVLGTVRSAPAADELEAGDTVVAVDGHEVQVADDLHELVSAQRAGTTFALTVERDGHSRVVRARSTRLPEVAGGIGLGILAETRNLQVDLPFRIRFRSREDVAGNSAGLAYALAIADMIDRTDNANGHTIAATGTVTAEGQVGPVGGTAEKAVAARDAGTAIFIVPETERDEARRSSLDVVGVTTLTQALDVLRSG